MTSEPRLAPYRNPRRVAQGEAGRVGKEQKEQYEKNYSLYADADNCRILADLRSPGSLSFLNG